MPRLRYLIGESIHIGVALVAAADRTATSTAVPVAAQRLTSRSNVKKSSHNVATWHHENTTPQPRDSAISS